MNPIDDLYRLSEILGDDMYKVVHVIRSFTPHDLPADSILSDLEDLNLEAYAEVMSHILDMSIEAIIEASQGMLFDDEASYIRYLHSLMDSNHLVYAPFVKRNLFD